MIQPGEPEWLPEDTDAALEWADWKASLCSCGQPRDESFDPAMEQEYEAEALRCHACAARSREEQNWRGDEHSDPGGIFIGVRRRGEDD